MAKKARTLRLAVGSQYGPRSRRWTITAVGPEVFVSCDPRSKVPLHFSLHESGVWHFKSDSHREQEGRAPIVRGRLEEQQAGFMDVVLTINIPERSLIATPDPATVGDQFPVDEWLERPVEDGLAQFVLMRCDTTGWGDKMPGTESFDPIWAIKAYRGGSAGSFLLYRTVPADHPAAVQSNTHWTDYLERRTEKQAAANFWFLGIGYAEAGCGVVLTECNY